MAILRIYDTPGWTLDQYDQVIAKLQNGGRHPGILLHAAGLTTGGARVIEGYESVDVADRFIQEHVAPAAMGLGLELPQMSGFTVHRAVGLPGV